MKFILLDMHTISIKKLLNALDVSNNGIVEEEEFIYLLEQAAASHADTSEFNKISDALLGKNAKSNYEAHLAKKKTIKMEKGGANNITLDQTVALADRVTHEQAYQCFSELYELEKTIEDPVDDIQTIFEKITKWKTFMNPSITLSRCSAFAFACPQ